MGKAVAAFVLLFSLPLIARSQSYTWEDITPDSLRGTPCGPLTASRNADGPLVLYARCRPGLMRSDDSGASWVLLRPNTGNFAVPYPDPDRIYAGVQDTLLASSDGGITWRSLNEAYEAAKGRRFSFPNEAFRWETSPFDADRLALVLSHAGYVYTTVDGGETFRKLVFPFDSHDGNILNAVASFKEQDRLFVHAYSYYPIDRSFGAEALFATEQWGASLGSYALKTGQPSECVSCLLTDTTGAIYMSHRRSLDAGATWETVRSSSGEVLSVRATSPVNAIAYAIEGTSPFVGYRIHLSGDNSRTWRHVADTPPSIPDAGQFTVFRLDPADSTLYVATSTGLFALSRQTTTGVAEVPESSLVGITTYPNPFVDEVTIEVTAPEAEGISVDVFDALGRQVGHVGSGTAASGERARFSFDGSSLPAGVYIVRATTQSGMYSRLVVRHHK